MEKEHFRRQSLPTTEQNTLKSDDGIYGLLEADLPGSGHWLWCQPFSEHNKSSPQTGWKLHISATSREMQEALAALAIDYKLAEFKFSPPATLEADQRADAGLSKGKTAVFYHAENGVDGNPINWEAFIREASTIVTAFGGAGQAVAGDRHIPGSAGIYYGADRKEAGGRSMPSSMRKSYSLGRSDDPFAAIDLQTEQDITKAVTSGAKTNFGSQEAQRKDGDTSNVQRT